MNGERYYPGIGVTLDSLPFTDSAGRSRQAETRPVPMDEADVIAARTGDRAAFGRLYARFLPMVHGLLLSRVPYADVDDLAQEVFLQALRKLASLRDPAAFGGWLATIARNRAHDFFRGARVDVELPETITAKTGKPDAEALAALTAIRRLPEAYRETLILRLVEGMSGPEIAARTGLTPGSVRVNLHRGMAQLRQILGKG
ncbi:MAG: sigma-70 family RNA polymerase sigma factor [Candidatus Acidiferrales bacterium]